MTPWMLQAAAAVVVVTLLAHSIVGERRLIAPVLAVDAEITQKPLAQAVLRFAWHFTSAIGFVIALMFWQAASLPETADMVVVGAAGAVLLIAGLVDAVWSKFQHIGWPMLTLAGALALAALL